MSGWGSLAAEWGPVVFLLVVFTLMVMLGVLVPRPFYRRMEADRDWWRKTAWEAMEQNQRLLTTTEVTSDVLKSLPTGEQ